MTDKQKQEPVDHTGIHFDDPRYFVENRGHFPLTEVVPGKDQKHGGRIDFMLSKLVQSGVLESTPDGKFKLSSGRNEKVSWLDVAAGTAPIARLVNKQFLEIIDITSTDITDTGVKVLENKEKEGLVFIKADIFKMPFIENNFEVVSAYDIMEHLVNPRGAIEECFRVLKPGGLFHIVVPNPYTLFTRANNHKTTYQRDPTHIVPPIVSTDYFREVLSLIGFISVEVSTRGHAETEEHFRKFGVELFRPDGGNHIYAWGWKK
jgi:ubiquinone/menaquinone biosynthesis C-methylase UbiE